MESRTATAYVRGLIVVPLFWLMCVQVQASPGVHFPSLKVKNERGEFIPVFSVDAYRAEFCYLRDQFHKTDLAGPPVQTDGWTYNIPEAEWPFMGFCYFGYACANFAGSIPAMRDDALHELRWLLDGLQTPRMSGFETPHFGGPFDGNQIHIAVFVHGHFLNLALRYRQISGDTRYDSLIHRVAGALQNEYLGPHGPVLASYRDMWWLTDNFPAVSALARYDKAFQRNSLPARNRFISAVENYYIDKRCGVFCTYVNPGNYRQLEGARGISTMYGLHFLKDFAPEFAAAQYKLATACFMRSALGMTAVREYPEGSESIGDVDSGPLIFGIGPSASGFAIAAAAINCDSSTAWKLLEASALVGMPQLNDGLLQYCAMPAVGQAVILFGKSELLKLETSHVQ